MRNFVVMSDGKIVTTCITRDTPDFINFLVNDCAYRYFKHSAVNEVSCMPVLKLCIPVCRKFYKYNPSQNEWYVTEDIKYLLMLDETEDKDLNYFQSTDFNAGVIYAAIDRAMGPLLGNHIDSIEKEIRLPKIQVIPKNFGSIKGVEVLDATVTAVLEHFVAVYGERFSIEMQHYNDPYSKAHIVFVCKVSRKEKYKKMTIAQIEEALGYKIKVVGNN